MVLYSVMYGDFTHLKNWSRWRPASGGGIMVSMFFFRLDCVVWFVVLGETRCCCFFVVTL